MTECYCGSGKSYEECCKPIIKNERKAKTAEELMRARYSAYAAKEIDFIMDSTVQNQTGNMPREAVEKWAKKTDWKRLEIVSVEKGGEEDTTGNVVFKAYSLLDGAMLIYMDLQPRPIRCTQFHLRPRLLKTQLQKFLL